MSLYVQNCQARGCSGIYEFIGEQENIGSNLTLLHRIEEREIETKKEPSILVYRCSKCRNLTFHLNEAYEDHIKYKRTQYYKELAHN